MEILCSWLPWVVYRWESIRVRCGLRQAGQTCVQVFSLSWVWRSCGLGIRQCLPWMDWSRQWDDPTWMLCSRSVGMKETLLMVLLEESMSFSCLWNVFFRVVSQFWFPWEDEDFGKMCFLKYFLSVQSYSLEIVKVFIRSPMFKQGATLSKTYQSQSLGIFSSIQKEQIINILQQSCFYKYNSLIILINSKIQFHIKTFKCTLYKLNIQFSFQMQPSFSASDHNKNQSIPKTIEKTSPVNTNPFFQYITSSKFTAAVPNSKVLVEGHPVDSQIKYTLNDKSSIDTISDPRKALRGNLQGQKLEQYRPQQQKLEKQKPQTNLRQVQEQKPSFNGDLKEKRSRSRDKSKSYHNRQISEENDKQENKDEHYRKTKMCPLFQKGQCKKGLDCHFAHGKKQLRGLPNFTKTRLCIAFQRGECKYPTNQCKYAHGQSQLRNIHHDGSYSIGLGRKQPINKGRGNQNWVKKDSQSAHRKDRRQKRSKSRQNLDDRRRKASQRQGFHNKKQGFHDKKQVFHDKKQAFYKKALPINTDYQKFLYGNAELNPPHLKNQSYMLPSEKPTDSKPIDPYAIDPYGVGLNDPYAVGFTKPSQQTYSLPSSSYVGQKQGYYKGIQKQGYLKGIQKQSYYKGMNRDYQKNSQPKRHGFYQKNRDSYNKEVSRYSASNEVFRNSSEFPLNAPQTNQRYREETNGGFYHGHVDPASEFNKNTSRTSFKPDFQDFSYAPGSGHHFFQNSNKFSEPLIASSSQKSFSTGYMGQYGQKQPVYYQSQSFYNAPLKKNVEDNFYNAPLKKNIEDNFYNPPMKRNVEDNFSSLQGQNIQPSYPISNSFSQGNPYPQANSYPQSNPYPKVSSYPNHGSLDVYPALDNSTSGGQALPRYSNSFQKNRYSSYSNNPSNR